MNNFLKGKLNINNLIIILCIGAVLMASGGLMPRKSVQREVKEEEREEKASVSEYEDDFEKRLEKILSQIDGAGEVKVMVTYESGGELVVKEDKTSESIKRSDESEQKKESKTVLANDEPFVIEQISPNVKGIIVVAQGGGNIEIKEKLINAVKALTGAEAHKIEVLKMKTGGK